MSDVFETLWGNPLKLEQKVAHICAEQERYGWLFADQKALEVRHALSSEKAGIDSVLTPLLPPKRIKLDSVEVGAPFRKDGTLADRVDKWFKGAAAAVRGPYSKVDWEPFNLSSVSQVKDFLLTLGWTPDEYNYNDTTGERTSPKLTESSLARLDHPLGKHIAQREVIEHRISLVDSLLKAVRADGRIPSYVNPLGTGTHRASHRVITNIPKAKAKVYYGIALRSLFTVPDGYNQLGVDAKGLQARCLAHYVNDPEFTAATISGDLHQDNLLALDGLCPDRDVVKNVLYCLLFGGGDWKLAWTAKHTGPERKLKAIGAEIRARLLGRWGAFEALTLGVKAAAKKGWLYGIDGRKLWLRGEHQALNALLQCMEAAVMKVAMCLLNDAVDEAGLDAHQLTWQHDEYQWEVLEAHTEALKGFALRCIPEAGEWLGSVCPLEADPKVGKTWAECH